MVSELATYFISVLIPLLVIINPISTIGIFLSLTKYMHEKEKNRVAFLSSLVAFCVLIFFAITGFWIFKIYGITIDAFRIAGGIALLSIGLKMLFQGDEQKQYGKIPSQIYLFPLAIPMTSGPGAITVTTVISGNVPDLWHQFIFWGAIFVACATNYLVLIFSERIDKIIGKEGLSAMIRIMGLLVASIAIQFIIVGLKATFPVLG